MLITGTSRGIGRNLAEHYADEGYMVVGCSRGPSKIDRPTYRHVRLDVTSEPDVLRLFGDIRKTHGRLDVLVNNAGAASMNHIGLTPLQTVQSLLNVNFVASFLFCREAAKIMQRARFGRIVNFTTVAVPLSLTGEAAYASSKAALETLTRIAAHEFAELGITVNAVGPTPIKTDLVRSVPETALKAVVDRQSIRRVAEFRDISNVVDFFIREESGFVTGQVIYLGGV